MGLFSKILKEITNTVVENVVGATGENNVDGIKTNNLNRSYELDPKYNIFPKYDGKIMGRPQKTSTDKYERVTMSFSGSVLPEFITSLTSNGFVKSTNVRYDKANTYVIVEDNGGTTKIVYHIKK